jgi:hypothetical protein
LLELLLGGHVILLLELGLLLHRLSVLNRPLLDNLLLHGLRVLDLLLHGLRVLDLLGLLDVLHIGNLLRSGNLQFQANFVSFFIVKGGFRQCRTLGRWRLQMLHTPK